MIDHDKDKSPLCSALACLLSSMLQDCIFAQLLSKTTVQSTSCRQTQNLLRHHKLQSLRRLFYVFSLLSLQETTYPLLNGPPSNLPFGYQKAVVFLSISHMQHLHGGFHMLGYQSWRKKQAPDLKACGKGDEKL